MTEKQKCQLLADENTAHGFVTACQRLVQAFPIVHIASWQGGSWLGLDDVALLLACAEANLILVAFDRATLPWHAARILRAGENHGGLILFRRPVGSTNYGQQARLLIDLWSEARDWDWINRVVYVPTSV
ncbi:MAG: hypothetical protein ACRENP_27660 [Longimicrobiales bacterium]